MAWIVDDTGFLKQGKHSVGVQQQYTGSAGKIANCHIGVSLSIATPQDHVAVDFELYLPTSWTNDPARRTEARIPPEVSFQTKSQLALSMLRRAVAADLPRGTVLADEAYGNAEFREGCRRLGLDFAVTISATTRAWVVDALGRQHGEALPARDLAARLAEQGAFRRYTWGEGTARPLTAVSGPRNGRIASRSTGHAGQASACALFHTFPRRGARGQRVRIRSPIDVWGRRRAVASSAIPIASRPMRSLIAMLIAAGVLAGCGTSNGNSTDFSVSPASVTVEIGRSTTVTATGGDSTAIASRAPLPQTPHDDVV